MPDSGASLGDPTLETHTHGGFSSLVYYSIGSRVVFVTACRRGCGRLVESGVRSVKGVDASMVGCMYVRLQPCSVCGTDLGVGLLPLLLLVGTHCYRCFFH